MEICSLSPSPLWGEGWGEGWSSMIHTLLMNNRS